MRKTTLVSVTLLSLAANVALAEGGVYQAHDHEPWHDQGNHDRLVSAPEIDPGQAAGALTLLGGAMAIIRAFRQRAFLRYDPRPRPR
jgi:hypothetical protein